MTAGISYLIMGGLSPGVFPPPVAPPSGGSGSSIMVAASGDDGWWQTGISFNNSGPYLTMGQYSAAIYHVFARFLNVGVSPGVSIDDARLDMWIGVGEVGVAFMEIYGELALNPTAPTSFADAESRVLTTQSSSMSYDGAFPGWQQSGNLSAIIAEITAQPGWVATNAINILIRIAGGGVVGAFAHSYDSSPIVAPRLTINAFPGQPTMRRWGGTPGMQPRRLGRGW